MVNVLCYKSEDRWFDPSWCHWIFHRHKILPITLWPWGLLSRWQKWVPGAFPGGKGGQGVRMTTYHHPVPLSRNLGTLTSWNSLGHSGPLPGLLKYDKNKEYITYSSTCIYSKSHWIRLRLRNIAGKGYRENQHTTFYVQWLPPIPPPPPKIVCLWDNVEKCGRVKTERVGTRAETRFVLPAKRTSPFISAGVSVQSSTGFLGVRVGVKRL